MSMGNEKVGTIMVGLRNSIKNGTDLRTNKPHYNIIYEAIWKLIDEIEQLTLRKDSNNGRTGQDDQG